MIKVTFFLFLKKKYIYELKLLTVLRMVLHYLTGSLYLGLLFKGCQSVTILVARGLQIKLTIRRNWSPKSLS